MTQEEKIEYVDYGLKLLKIELHKELLEKILQVVELVDNKKGETTIKDVLKLTKQRSISRNKK